MMTLRGAVAGVGRFLDGDIDPADPANQQPVFVISTSAGEVGIDLNAVGCIRSNDAEAGD
jgi:hypothetical protein